MTTRTEVIGVVFDEDVESTDRQKLGSANLQALKFATYSGVLTNLATFRCLCDFAENLADVSKVFETDYEVL